MADHPKHTGRVIRFVATAVAALALATVPLAAEDAAVEAKPLGNFDDGEHPGWAASTDEIMNGTSTAALAIEDGALAVSGELKSGFIFPFGGAALGFSEGTADLSAFKTLNFRVRGDGRTYRIMVITGGAAMGPPPSFPFETGEEWQDTEIYLADFGADFSAVQALTFVATETPGAFAFQLDDVVLR